MSWIKKREIIPLSGGGELLEVRGVRELSPKIAMSFLFDVLHLHPSSSLRLQGFSCSRFVLSFFFLSLLPRQRTVGDTVTIYAKRGKKSIDGKDVEGSIVVTPRWIHFCLWIFLSTAVIVRLLIMDERLNRFEKKENHFCCLQNGRSSGNLIFVLQFYNCKLLKYNCE